MGADGNEVDGGLVWSVILYLERIEGLKSC